jgi:hypothetical protein
MSEDGIEQCAIPGCDWPHEWVRSDLCARHDYERWAFWAPLSHFGPIEEVDSYV